MHIEYDSLKDRRGKGCLHALAVKLSHSTVLGMGYKLPIWTETRLLKPPMHLSHIVETAPRQSVTLVRGQSMQDPRAEGHEIDSASRMHQCIVNVRVADRR